MQRIRAFVALNLPIATTNTLVGVQRELAEQAAAKDSRISWVPAPNIHVTLKFLGEIPAESAFVVRDLLQEKLIGRQSWSMGVRGVGVFPAEQQPRVVWAGLADNGETAALAADIDGWLDGIGFPREKRPFHAHATLGRIRESNEPFWLEQTNREIGECNPTEVVFYESQLHRQGAEYVVLGRIPLDGGSSSRDQEGREKRNVQQDAEDDVNRCQSADTTQAANNGDVNEDGNAGANNDGNANDGHRMAEDQ